MRARATAFALLGLIVLVALAILFAPAKAQQAGKVYRIGTIQWVSAQPRESILRTAPRGTRVDRGSEVVIETRFAEGKLERLPVLVGDLLRLNVDVIVANDTPTAKVAKEATRTVPIVIGVGDSEP